MVNKKVLGIILVLLFVGGGGLLCIRHASTISEFIVPKDYFFRFDSKSDKDMLNLLVFNLSYDFTNEEGVITFFPSNTPAYIRIYFPSFISDKTTVVDSFKCDTYSYNCKKRMDMKIEKEFIPTPPDSPYFTTLVLSDFNRSFHSFEKIIIKFKMNIKPNGLYIITQSQTTKIQQANYALNFILGDDFQPPYREFIDLIEGVKLYEGEGINEKDIKLEFEGDYHAFRIKTISSEAIFERTFWLGLGASLIGATIALIAQLVLSLFNNKDSKKLKILNKLLDGQIKIKGIEKKKLEIIKNKFR